MKLSTRLPISALNGLSHSSELNKDQLTLLEAYSALTPTQQQHLIRMAGRAERNFITTENILSTAL